MRKEKSTFPCQKLPWWKQLLFFVIGWIGLQATALVFEIGTLLVAKIFNFEAGLTSQSWYGMFINSAVYLVIFFTFCGLINIDVVKIFKTKKVWLSFLAGAGGLVVIYTFNFVYSNLIQFIKPVSDNANETAINSIVDVYPVISLIVFGVIGPIVEEITYRVGLFSLLKRKSRVLAYILTIVIFTFIHFDFDIFFVVVQDPTQVGVLINELLNIPLYAFAAATFCFIFDKFGFIGSTTAHILNNLSSILIEIVLSSLL